MSSGPERTGRLVFIRVHWWLSFPPSDFRFRHSFVIRHSSFSAWLSPAKHACLPLVSDVTRILAGLSQGDPNAADQLLPLVYEELRKLAALKMSKEIPGQTLQPTALVHEAWLRLTGNQKTQWDGRAHFFAAAAEAMRRILIDRARRKRALRHGGGQERVPLDDGLALAAPADDDQLLAVHEGLDKLAVEHKAKAELVKLRYFVGMTNGEAADVLGISVRTAKYYWTHARAWLYKEIKSRVA